MSLAGATVKAQSVKPPVASPPAPTPSAIGPRLALSLADAVFIGLRDNRAVKSAYIDRVSQKFDLFVAEARFRPTAVLNASVEATRQGGMSGTSYTLTPTATWLVPTGAQFQFSWSKLDSRLGGINIGSDVATLSVTQPLLKGAGFAVNEAPIKVARLQERINRLGLKSTVSQTVTAIILAYRALAQAQQQAVIAQESLDRAQAQLRSNQAFVDAGRMAAADLVQTRAEIANQQVSLLGAQQQRNSAQLALLALLAMDLHINVAAADPIEAPHAAIDLDKAIAIGLDNRMDILSQRLALEQARQNLIVAKNNRLWTLSVVGSVSRETQSGGGSLVINPATGLPVPGLDIPLTNLPATTGTVGLELSIPLGDFTLRQQEIQAATAVRTDELGVAELDEQIEAQVRDAVQAVELSWRQVEAARQARDLAAQTVELETERQQAGRASNFEVLSFQTDLKAAEIQALSAQIAYLDALTTLDEELGTTLDTWKVSLND
ncbi:MAG TPA: TolC family protein [Caulobacteraceae bacterium]|jgi:outer membrane protein TolC|nr:TolC family protein [Caulobacteraceae bacterium]